jgi:hypothetical protein
MEPIIDYASGQGCISNSRIRYFVLISCNSVVLLLGAVLFSLESSGDNSAPFAGIFFGGPLLFIELVLGCASWIYLWRRRMVMDRRWKDAMIALSVLPSLTGTVGILIATFVT